MNRTGGPSPLRRLAFAGTWYAGDPDRLADDVDAALDAAVVSSSRARAVVSPHAGLIYSGHVAAHSYRALGPSPREAVVLVGPSHYEAFRGCAMLRQGALETPWGSLPIAESLARWLRQPISSWANRPLGVKSAGRAGERCRTSRTSLGRTQGRGSKIRTLFTGVLDPLDPKPPSRITDPADGRQQLWPSWIPLNSSTGIGSLKRRSQKSRPQRGFPGPSRLGPGMPALNLPASLLP